ncbi:MAG TPA: DedA family protein [Paludibacter sp.]|nr:DedA family protein [Paludibacter sp.]
MPTEITSTISQYGYLAIFLLIFLQEIGFPSPIPNELVLLFSGYLAFMGVIYFPIIIIVALVADFLAGSVLYTVFYFFGNYIFSHIPKWIPFPTKKIEKVSERVKTQGQSSIFVGRLTPFVRGYVAVIAGLFQLPPKKYGTILIITSTIWAFAYVMVGFLIGPYWDFLTKRDASDLEFYITLISGILIIGIIAFILVRKFLVRT